MLLAATLLVSGCATVVNGRTQSIGVSSTPTGATVLVDNQYQVLTPATLDLARSQNHTFLFRKEGYQDNSSVITHVPSGWVLVDNVLSFGVLAGPSIVDIAIGSAYKLSQNSVHVTLTLLSVGQAPTSALPVSPPASSPAPALSVDGQLRTLETDFRASRITMEDYRAQKKALLNQQ